MLLQQPDAGDTRRRRLNQSLHTAKVPPRERHGEPIPAASRLAASGRLLRNSNLLGGPKLDDTSAGVFAEVEAERKADFGRATDLGTDR